MPDWTQLFARTLSLRPQLLNQLNNVSVDNNTDNDGNDCSLAVIDTQRSWLIDDIDQECQRHQPIECPEHVRTPICFSTFHRVPNIRPNSFYPIHFSQNQFNKRRTEIAK